RGVAVTRETVVEDGAEGPVRAGRGHARGGAALTPAQGTGETQSVIPVAVRGYGVDRGTQRMLTREAVDRRAGCDPLAVAAGQVDHVGDDAGVAADRPETRSGDRGRKRCEAPGRG